MKKRYMLEYRVNDGSIQYFGFEANDDLEARQIAAKFIADNAIADCMLFGSMSLED